jgi:hypothetical protein
MRQAICRLSAIRRAIKFESQNTNDDWQFLSKVVESRRYFPQLNELFYVRQELRKMAQIFSRKEDTICLNPDKIFRAPPF